MSNNKQKPTASITFQEECVGSTGSLPSQKDVERLGREKPPAFSSFLAEFGFCFSILMSVFIVDYFMSGFHTILPALAEALSIPEGLRTWPSSVLSLVTGAFLLPVGRMSDIFGGYIVYNIGFVLFTVFAFAGGLSTNPLMLICFRAIQGLGSAAVMPAGMMLIGKIYRPGPRKNIVFGLYGAFAVLGLFAGIMIGGLAGQYLDWQAYFYIGGAVSAVGCGSSLLCIPHDFAESRKRCIKMDWLGAAAIVPGLCLVVFAFTDSTNAPGGWKNPYIITTLVLGAAILAVGIFIEGWVAKSPLVPPEVFQVKYMKRMVFCLFVDYGVFGIYLFYSNYYIEVVLEKSPLTTAVWFTPWAIGGTLLAFTGGVILHIIPGRYLLILSGTSKIVAVLFFAIMPDNPSYWAFILPAMVAETLFSDIIYTLSNVFITTSLPVHLKGVAAALINCSLYTGVAFFLACADITVGATSHLGDRTGFKSAFWLGTAAATVALAVFATMDIGSAKSDYTADEKMQQENAS